MAKKSGEGEYDSFEWIKMKAEMNAVAHDETTKEKFLRKFGENPLVPVGCLATAGALVYGLITFRKGDSKTSQLMMRCRILAQGFTVAALIGGITMAAMKQT